MYKAINKITKKTINQTIKTISLIFILIACLISFNAGFAMGQRPHEVKMVGTIDDDGFYTELTSLHDSFVKRTMEYTEQDNEDMKTLNVAIDKNTPKALREWRQIFIATP